MSRPQRTSTRLQAQLAAQLCRQSSTAAVRRMLLVFEQSLKNDERYQRGHNKADDQRSFHE